MLSLIYSFFVCFSFFRLCLTSCFSRERLIRGPGYMMVYRRQNKKNEFGTPLCRIQIATRFLFPGFFDWKMYVSVGFSREDRMFHQKKYLLPETTCYLRHLSVSCHLQFHISCLFAPVAPSWIKRAIKSPPVLCLTPS